MTPTITHQCGHCRKFFECAAREGQSIVCPYCRKNFGVVPALNKIFESCPVCGCSQFWVQKDFNPILGFAIVLVGIILVPKTYGLSLPLFALIDWIIYKKISTMVVCYKCASEFRGLAVPSQLKPFLHHIGLKYDKYR